VLGDTSLAVYGEDVHISYYDLNDSALKYAAHDASGWHIEAIAPHAGWYTSLALDGNGNPHISYYDQATYDLRVVFACAPVEGVSAVGPVDLLVGETGVYTATSSPVTATLPITVTWDNGTAGATAVYSWTVPGQHTLTVTAENCGGTVSAAQAITVSELPPTCPRPLSGVSISGFGAGYTDIHYAFAAVTQPLDATLPITYTWSPVPDSGRGTSAPEYQWTAPGVYSITLEAENCGGVVSATHTITISESPPTCPRPLRGVTISGQGTGYTGMACPFGAVSQPPGASEPIVYAWSPEPDTGQGTASATYSWPNPGNENVTVTAGNCGGPVSTTHAIVIKGRVYLPLVMRFPAP